VWFVWHAPGEIEQLLANCGFESVRLTGVGVTSGMPGDPLEPIARPADLDPDERRELYSIESALAESHPWSGRYALALGTRPR